MLGQLPSNLPDFLDPFARRVSASSLTPPFDAIFWYKRLPLSSHAHWWPSSTGDTSTVLLFVPGNPGLIDFYTPFLAAIHNRTGGRLPILARAHLGQTPGLDEHAPRDPSSIALAAQVESLIEVADALKRGYERVVVVAHSMGSWLTLQLLKARPNLIDSIFLLFPTITHIKETPNGRNLSWVFNPPIPTLVSQLSPITRLLPFFLLQRLFAHWPHEQTLVLQNLLGSPSAIYASLTMAHDEMNLIKDLDVELLQAHHHKVHLYFAEDDKWVGEQKKHVLAAVELDEGNVRIVHGHPDIPHAFCINHGDQLAEQCHEWLRSGFFI